jgi:hypothetical protein
VNEQQIELTLVQLRTAREQTVAANALVQKLETRLTDAGILFTMNETGSSWKRVGQREESQLTREHRLAIALQAALRWPYVSQMWRHIRKGFYEDEAPSYAAEYRNDIEGIVDGVRAAEELGIVAVTDEQVGRAGERS